jgi:hypothetical protein
MDLTQLHPEVLRSLLKLSEQKSALLSELKAIDGKIATLSTGRAVPRTATGARRGRKPGRKRGRKPGRPPGTGASAQAPKPPKAKRGRKAKRGPQAKRGPKAGRTGKRGALKSRILGLLGSAGSEGISVREISSRLNVKPQNVHVWFSSTGKKMGEIEKIGEARYAIKPTPATHHPAPAPAPQPEAQPVAF